MRPDDGDDGRTTTFVRRDLLRKGAAGVGAVGLGVAGFSGTSVAGCTGKHECARTPGFWKNHTEMWHGEKHLHLGMGDHSETKYKYFKTYTTPSGTTHPSAEEILGMKPKGDKSIIMAKHLIATILNKKAGTDTPCIDHVIWKARKWLDEYPVGSDQRKWEGGEWIKNELDAYNNGRRCACKAD